MYLRDTYTIDVPTWHLYHRYLCDTIHRPEAQHYGIIFFLLHRMFSFSHKKCSGARMGGPIGPKLGMGHFLIWGNILTHHRSNFNLRQFSSSHPAITFCAKITYPQFPKHFLMFSQKYVKFPQKNFSHKIIIKKFVHKIVKFSKNLPESSLNFF